MKKDQIKSRSEYKIMGFTLENMLEMAYRLGSIDEHYHPNDKSDTKMKEAIYQASKIGNWDVFEIIEK
tara:strand:+ start:1811 stop:2014 length:204 start_codon:yes stop_codon:yes gene_type:complete